MLGSFTDKWREIGQGLVICVALVAWLGSCDRLVASDPAPTTPSTAGVRPAADAGRADASHSDSGGAADGSGGGQLLNPNNYPAISGAFALGNDTWKARTVRVRSLRPEVRLDCQVVAAAPTAALAKALFAPAKTWVLNSGRALPVNAPAMLGGDCRAVLIDGTDLPLKILFWHAAAWPKTVMPSTLSAAAPGRLLRLVEVEGSVELAAHEVAFGGPTTTTAAPAPACALPADSAALAWAEPAPTGPLSLLGRVDAPDGCMALKVKTGQGPLTWHLCLPTGSFPFVAGDDVYAQVLLGGHHDGPVKGMQWRADDGRLLRFGVGAEPVAFAGGETSAKRVQGCAGVHDSCGNLSVPLELSVVGALDADATTLRSGESLKVGGGTLRLVRARELPVMDTGCLAPAPAGSRRIETVWTGAVK